MNKSLRYSFAAISAVTIISLGAVGSKPAIAQVAQGLLALQTATPGVSQTGNTNISGTAKAGQFVGGGAGLTNLNADLLDGQDGVYYTNAQNLTGTINDNRLSTNVPLLNATQTFTAANTFNNAVTVNARTTTSNFTMTTGGAANTVLLGATGGVASWGTVGNARLTSDSASLSKVTGGAFSINAGTLQGGDQRAIDLLTGTALKVRLTPNVPGSGGFLAIYGNNGSLNCRATSTANPDHGSFGAFDAAGAVQAQMYVDAAGNGVVAADTKSFVVPDPTDARYNIVYACVEGPEAAMYTRGTGRLANGQAVIELPDHYLKLANLATATIQVTPLDDCRGLFVKKSNGMIIVKELGGGKANVEFDWRIEAVRKGHEDYRPVRPWNDALPAGDEQEMWNARLQSIAAKQAMANRSNRP